MVEGSVEYRGGQIVSAALSSLADAFPNGAFDVHGMSRGLFTFTNTGASLTGFVVQIRPFADAGLASPPPMVTIASATGDFTTPKGLVIGASGDLTAMATGSAAWLILDLRGVKDLLFRGSCGSSTVLTTNFGLSNL